MRPRRQALRFGQGIQPETKLGSIRSFRMDTVMFSSRKRGVFRRGKEIKSLQIDAARAEKNRFQPETIWRG